MQKVEYEIYQAGEPVKKTVDVCVKTEVVYIDTVRANQAVNKWCADNDMEVGHEMDAIKMILAWIRKDDDGAQFTVDELVQERTEKINALAAQALLAFSGVRDVGKKSPRKRSSGAK